MVLSLFLFLGIKKKKVQILISCGKESWRSNIKADGRQQNEISWSGSIYYTVEKSNFFFFFVSSKNYNPLNITESQVGTGIPEFSTYEPHVDLCYIN